MIRHNSSIIFRSCKPILVARQQARHLPTPFVVHGGGSHHTAVVVIVASAATVDDAGVEAADRRLWLWIRTEKTRL
jgi:hypothetical protein